MHEDSSVVKSALTLFLHPGGWGFFAHPPPTISLPFYFICMLISCIAYAALTKFPLKRKQHWLISHKTTTALTHFSQNYSSTDSFLTKLQHWLISHESHGKESLLIVCHPCWFSVLLLLIDNNSRAYVSLSFSLSRPLPSRYSQNLAK